MFKILRFPIVQGLILFFLAFAAFSHTAQAQCSVTIDGPEFLCAGGNTSVFLEADVSGATGQVTYQWSSGQTSKFVHYSFLGATTTFSVTITDSNGCTATDAFTVNVLPPTLPGPFSISNTPIPPICSGQTVTLTVNQPPGSYFYIWNDGQTTQTVQRTMLNIGLSASVMIHNEVSCASAFTTIPVAPGYNVSIVSDSSNTRCTGKTYNLRAFITNNPVGYTFTPDSYQWSTGATGPEIFITEGGTYTVTVTSTSGCPRTASIGIQPFLPSPEASATGPEFLCPGKTDTLTAGPQFALAYQWSNNLPNIRRPIIATAGTYRVTVTANNTCSGTATVVVQPGATPPVTIVAPPSICVVPPQVKTLSVTGASNLVSYLWSTDATTPTAEIFEPGPYRVTVVNSQGCSGTAFVNVPSGDITNIPISGLAPSLCATDTAVLRVNGNFTNFLWSSGKTTAADTIVGPGAYSVTVTNPGGCTAVRTVTIPGQQVNFSLNQPAAICPGDTAVLQVSGPNLNSFKWSTGQTTAGIAVTQPGNYRVTVVDNTGCGAAGTVSVPARFTDNAPIQTLPYACDGRLRLRLAADSLSTVVWSTGDSLREIQVNQSGKYRVRLVSRDGCVRNDSISVNVPAAPQVAIARTGVLCENTGGAVALDASPGLARYAWSTGDSTAVILVTQPGRYAVQAWDSLGCPAADTLDLALSILPDPLPLALPYACDNQRLLAVNDAFAAYLWSNGAQTPTTSVTAPGDYALTVSNADGCTKTALLANVDIPAPPTVSIGGAQPFCPGSTVTLQADPGFQTYLWSSGETDPSLTIGQAGTYAVTVTDTDGCTAQASVQAQTLPIEPLIIRGATSICVGRVSVFTIEGGPWENYLWSTGETTPAITVSEAGAYGITATNAFGCSGVASFQLTVADSLSPTITTLPYQCDGLMRLDAGSGYANYLWSNGFAAPTLAVDQSGTYAVTVSDGDGCSGSALVNIQVPALLDLTLDAPDYFCQGAPAQALAGGGFESYAWSDGVSGAQRPILTGGVYAVTATDAYGCTAVKTVSVSEIPLPAVDIQGPAILCAGTASFLLAESPAAAVYQWSTNNDNTPLLIVNAGGTYALTVTDALGCSNTAEFQVQESAVAPPAISQQNLCDGRVRLDVAGSYSAYAWSFGGAAPSAELNTAGDYALTLTNADGCTAAFPVAVDIPPAPVATITPDGIDVCAGSPATLIANPGMAAYLWSTGADAAAIQINQSGAYALTVTDTDGCTATTTLDVQLTDTGAPALVCPDNLVRCFDEAQTTFDLPTATDNCAVNSLTQTAGLPSGSTFPPGITLNAWLAADNAGNTAACTFTIEVLPGATLDLIALTNDIGGALQGAIEVSVSGPNGPFSFEWTLNGQPFATTEDLQGLGAGQYTLLVRDASGCLVGNQTFTVDNLTSIDDPANAGAVRLLPNPTTGLLLLQTGARESYDLLLFDLTGRLVLQQPGNTAGELRLDLQRLPAGTYTLVYRTAAQQEVFRVVKVD